MLIKPESVHFDDARDELIIQAKQCAHPIQKMQESPRFDGCDLRFAAARLGADDAIVIGYRHEGRGFDVVIEPPAWPELMAGPSVLRLVYAPEAGESGEMLLDWPEDAFESFIEQCAVASVEDASRVTLARVADAFGVMLPSEETE